ncbi:hypothetical protein [Pedobacter psychrodurus]|uniref:hypothetical protein n=1 Tax=Pedobacter psychrodurus TaxID=2530456 RepID=UPI00293124C3|nr:hypothetical protein [Pedobacter psychrodurus]
MKVENPFSSPNVEGFLPKAIHGDCAKPTLTLSRASVQQNIALKVIIDSFFDLMVMMREQVFWDNQKYTLKDKAGTDLKNSAKLVKDWCIYWKLG